MMAAGLDPGLTEFGGEVPGGTRRWLAVVLLLAAGWGALFAYSTMFLTEEVPLRPASADAARSETAAFDFPADDGPHPAPAPRPPIRKADDDAKAPAKPVAEVRAEPKPAEAVTPAPRPDRAEYVGTWGPTPAACGARSRRRGYIPATITPERAQAGRTICSFHEGHRSGNAWVMAADCSDRGRRWSSQVRLLVEGDRLTWSSAKGSSSYIRCSRRG